MECSGLKSVSGQCKYGSYRDCSKEIWITANVFEPNNGCNAHFIESPRPCTVKIRIFVSSQQSAVRAQQLSPNC